MKKCLFFVVLIPLFSFVQNSMQDKFKEIPVENGKVIFVDTVSTPFDKPEIRNKLYYWVNSAETKERYISDIGNNPDACTFSCKVSDYLNIERTSLSSFSLYMIYTLSFRYEDNLCVVRIYDVNYIEPGDMGRSKNADIGKYMIPAGTALIGKKYKPAFIKNASGKIMKSTLQNVNTLLYSVQKQLNPRNKSYAGIL